VQGERSVEVLHALRQFFGCGVVSVNRRHDNHRQDMWRYSVRHIADPVGHIVPFFEQHPLRAAKSIDFSGFSRVVGLMQEGAHLDMGGVVQIAGIAKTINRQQPSRLAESSEAIRQPAGFDDPAEEMVLASWRHEGR
jgi:hypothetical protein